MALVFKTAEAMGAMPHVHVAAISTNRICVISNHFGRSGPILGISAFQGGVMDHDVLLDRYEILKRRKRRQNIATVIVGIVLLLIMLIWIGPIMLRR